MKVYRGIDEFNKLSNAVVTSGIFDGVHKGHQKILSRLMEAAKETGGEGVVLTFWPHPKKILGAQNDDLQILTTLEEKINLISEINIDHLIIIPFTKEFSQLSSDEFIKKILVNKVGTKKLVIGHDHKFGKNREGGFEYLKKNAHILGFEVEEIPKQDVDNIGVSSTIIRKSLKEGDISTAANYLGRFYSLSGKVVKGKQLGKTLGYPTANIEVEDADKLIPKDGIYAVKVEYENYLFNGMMSIGYNPTVDGTLKTIEVNIFDFDKDIYNKMLDIKFVEFLRDEEKFENIEKLKEQLKKDKDRSLGILNKCLNH